MKTVLVVDDEFGVAEVLVTALDDEGYRVAAAANGRQGLERLTEVMPDLALIDFMMPLMDGPEMARAMQADPAYRHIPIIMMSAVPESAVRERFDGYRAFLRKPFRIPTLLDVVAGVLGS